MGNKRSGNGYGFRQGTMQVDLVHRRVIKSEDEKRKLRKIAESL